MQIKEQLSWRGVDYATFKNCIMQCTPYNQTSKIHTDKEGVVSWDKSTNFDIAKFKSLTGLDV